MWKKISLLTCFFSSMSYTPGVLAGTFGQSICHGPGLTCHKVRPGETWQSLFPNANARLTAKKINRMNTALRRGMIIASPKGGAHLMAYAPFPGKIAAPGTKVVQISLSKLAWGAYSPQGTLLNWGPISGGKNYCNDTKRGCRTIRGSFTIYRKQGPGCTSSRFPLPRGGAPMPYCMHFHGGFAMHGSGSVPGYNASHGCVRLFHEDARWLNQNFVTPGSTRVRIY